MAATKKRDVGTLIVKLTKKAPGPLKRWAAANTSVVRAVVQAVIEPSIPQMITAVRRGIRASAEEIKTLRGYDDDKDPNAGVFTKTCLLMMRLETAVAADPRGNEAWEAKNLGAQLGQVKNEAARLFRLYEDVKHGLKNGEGWAQEDLSDYKVKNLEELAEHAQSRRERVQEHARGDARIDPDSDRYDAKLARDYARYIELETQLQRRAEAGLARFREAASDREKLQARLPNGWEVTAYNPNANHGTVLTVNGPTKRTITATFYYTDGRHSYYNIDGAQITGWKAVVDKVVGKTEFYADRDAKEAAAAQVAAERRAAAARGLAAGGELPLAPATALKAPGGYFARAGSKKASAVVQVFGEDLAICENALIRMGPATAGNLRDTEAFADTADADLLASAAASGFMEVDFRSEKGVNPLAVVADFAAVEDHRYGINGVYLEEQPSSVGGLSPPPCALIATDGHRLHAEATPAVPIHLPSKTLIPRSMLTDPQGDGVVATDARVRLWLSPRVIAIPLDGEFPDYTALIPGMAGGKRGRGTDAIWTTTGAVKDCKPFIAAIKAAVKAYTAETPPTLMVWDGQTARLGRGGAVNGVAFRTPWNLPASLAFSFEYFMETLAVFGRGSAPITVRGGHALSPVLFTQGGFRGHSETWQRFHILMPMRAT